MAPKSKFLSALTKGTKENAELRAKAKPKPPVGYSPRGTHTRNDDRDTDINELADQMDKVEVLHGARERELAKETGIAAILDEETGMAEAHQLFVYGIEGQKPVRDVQKLSKITGVSAARLKIMASRWNKEVMRLAREASPLFAMAASLKARADHNRDLERMREKIEAFEKTIPDPDHKDFQGKYRMLMMMRKEWQDSAGVTAAIEISKTCMLWEAKNFINASNPQADTDAPDLSGFDIDV